jgi:hypothetical protein
MKFAILALTMGLSAATVKSLAQALS